VVLGHQSVRCGLGDARGQLMRDADGPLLEGRAAPGLEGGGPQQVLSVVAKLAEGLVARAGLPAAQIRGVTVALPAPVDLSGRLSSRRILPGFAGHADLRPAVHAALVDAGLGALRVDIDNDANVAGAGEWLLRDGGDPAPGTLLVVKVSGGIGGALVDAGGRLLRGATGAAGELGHLPADPSGLDPAVAGLPQLAAGAPCRRCGGSGHLESYVSAPAIADRVFGADGEADYSTRHVLLMNALADPADEHHERARAAVADAGTLLGRALIPVAEFADPGLIVITGRMRNAGELFTGAVQRALHGHDRVIAVKPAVVASSHGWSGVLGAIHNTLRNEPPPFGEELRETVLVPLLRDMRNGPPSWRAAAALLGPQH
jgi:predicted NBD/HSP70 family sugar kinase